MTETDPRYDEAKRRVEARMGLLTHAVTFVVINVVFLAIVGWDWLWVTLFWGIGLFWHAWGVLVANSGWYASYRERAIHKEMTRGEPQAPAGGWQQPPPTPPQ